MNRRFRFACWLQALSPAPTSWKIARRRMTILTPKKERKILLNFSSRLKTKYEKRAINDLENQTVVTNGRQAR
jgi:hypothetical protein